MAEPGDEGLSRIGTAPAELAGSSRTIWALVALVMLGLGAAGLVIVRAIESGPRPPFLVQPPVSPTTETRPQDPLLLRLAGSGSNLPVTRALADAFEAAHAGSHVVVHASIGSTGGVRATADGAVDVGLVSRGLKDSEKDLGLRVVPYAHVAVVFAANRSVRSPGLSSAEVLDLYAGRHARWPGEIPVVVLQREEGDSSHLVAASAIEGFGDIDSEALDTQRWRVLYRDSAMLEALLSTSGSIGLIDLGAARSEDLDLRILSLDGVQPTEANVLDGSYPMDKQLAFVVDDSLGELGREFIEFVFSPAGQEIIRNTGYIPLPKGAP